MYPRCLLIPCGDGVVGLSRVAGVCGAGEGEGGAVLLTLLRGSRGEAVARLT